METKEEVVSERTHIEAEVNQTGLEFFKSLFTLGLHVVSTIEKGSEYFKALDEQDALEAKKKEKEIKLDPVKNEQKTSKRKRK